MKVSENKLTYHNVHEHQVQGIFIMQLFYGVSRSRHPLFSLLSTEALQHHVRDGLPRNVLCRLFVFLGLPNGQQVLFELK